MDSANWRSNIINFLSIYPSFLFWTSKLYPRLCKVLSHQTNDVTVHLTASSHDTFVSPLFGLWNDVCNIIFHQAKDSSFCQATLIKAHLFAMFWLEIISIILGRYNKGFIRCALALEFFLWKWVWVSVQSFPYCMNFVMALTLLQLLYKFVQTFSKGS